MLYNNDVQAALISYLKANATITALLTAGATEIRENNWQGTDFTYPNIRVKLDDLIPNLSGCGIYEALFTILSISEDKSSKQADRISGVIAGQIHNHTFSQAGSEAGVIVRFSSIKVERLIPAQRIGDIWQSGVQVRALVQ